MKRLRAIVALLLSAVAGAVAAQRPQLDAAQARAFTRDAVLAAAGPVQALVRDGWDPLADAAIGAEAPPALHYRVDARGGDGAFATAQQAIERAKADIGAGTQRAPRIVIGIAPGEYEGLTFVPPLPVPLTLWGLGRRPQDVRLHAAASAGTSGAELARRYALPLDSPYLACAQQATIGTGCSPVMWVRNRGFQLRGVSVENRFDETPGAPGQQAVALATEADRVHLEGVHLAGHQDTLYLRTAAPDEVARVFIHASHIEGDVDFIFGGATAYVMKSRVHWVGTRGVARGWIAAPSTNLHAPYGFVFDACDFTSDAPVAAAPAPPVHLARQWFAGARCSPYGDRAAACEVGGALERRSLEAVGKVVVLRSRLGAHIPREAPWAAWNADPAHPAYRLAQFTSDDFWHHLQAAGRDPRTLGYTRPAPPQPWLAEHCNHGPGAAVAGPACAR